MKRAFASAGIGFFATPLVLMFLLGSYDSPGAKDLSTAEFLLTSLVMGVIVGGLVFFITWYKDLDRK